LTRDVTDHQQTLAERLSEATAGVRKAVAADLPMEAKTPGKTTMGRT
jgi:hypothetical protein